MTGDTPDALSDPIAANRQILESKLGDLSAKWLQLFAQAGVTFNNAEDAFDSAGANTIHKILIPRLSELRREAEQIRSWEMDRLQGLTKTPRSTRAHGHLEYIERVMLSAYILWIRKALSIHSAFAVESHEMLSHL